MTVVHTLSDLVGNHSICVVDVGAADGLAKRWRPIAAALKVVAFEPDSRSRIADGGMDDSELIVVAQCAAEKEMAAPFYLTRKPRCSSLLRPNVGVIGRHPDPGRYDVVGQKSVDCTTVDIALRRLGIAAMDFIKIDTQGSEIDVLQGAEKSLARCLGIEVEVQFQQLYEGACVFREVDAYVSKLGFELFDLRRTFLSRDVRSPIRQRKGQLIFGDALYFRDWQTDDMDRQQSLRLAVLLLTYGYADVVVEMLAARGRRGSS